MRDNVSYAFSSAFTMSPDSMQPHIIPEEPDDDLLEERWYTPPPMSEPNPITKRLCFSSNTKPPNHTEHTEISDFEIVRI